MKFILAIVLLSILATYSYSQEGSKKKKKYPEIKFAEKVHNVGKVYEDETVKHDFIFINTGNAPLVIKNATASCNCTVADWHKAPVMPGDSGTVTATFNPKGYAGRTFRKTITVFTNAREDNERNMVYGVQIIGRVIKRK